MNLPANSPAPATKSGRRPKAWLDLSLGDGAGDHAKQAAVTLPAEPPPAPPIPAEIAAAPSAERADLAQALALLAQNEGVDNANPSRLAEIVCDYAAARALLPAGVTFAETAHFFKQQPLAEAEPTTPVAPSAPEVAGPSPPDGVADNLESVAETITGNIRNKIAKEQASDPVFYEQMAALLEGIVGELKSKQIDYSAFLKRIAEVSKQVQSGKSAEPSAIASSARPESRVSERAEPSAPDEGKDNAESVATTIAQNIRNKIAKEQTKDPPFYSKMSSLLNGLVAELKAQSIDHKSFLRRIAEVSKQVQSGKATDSPAPAPPVPPGPSASETAEPIPPAGVKSKLGTVAETIAQNIRGKIEREQPKDPAFYGQMAVTLEEIIAELKAHRIDHLEFLKRIAEVAKQVQSGKLATTPTTLKTAGQRALFNNLGLNEDLALKIDKKVKEVHRYGWRGNEAREKAIKAAILPLLNDDQAAADRIFLILTAQPEY